MKTKETKPKTEVKTVKISKQDGRYYPVENDTIDMRGPGSKSIKAFRENYEDRTGEACCAKVV